MFIPEMLQKVEPAVVYACNPSYLGGRGRRIMFQGQSGQKRGILSEKQTENKSSGGMAQMVECLSSRLEALSSNLHTHTKGLKSHGRMGRCRGGEREGGESQNVTKPEIGALELHTLACLRISGISGYLHLCATKGMSVQSSAKLPVPWPHG
jgi:hypothetical protein